MKCMRCEQDMRQVCAVFVEDNVFAFVCEDCEQKIKAERGMLCDFCSQQPAYASYPARDITFEQVGGVQDKSIGEWIACRNCYDFIELGQYQRLTQRSIELYTGPGEHEAHLVLALIHEKFKESRTGPAVILQEVKQ
jgi:hypothetical protein